MKNNQNKGLIISNEAIIKAGLGDEIAVIGTDSAIVIAGAKMTAMELIKTIDSLAEITQGYLAILSKNCGECDDCGHCEDLDFEGIHLPDGVLEIAGIPVGTKLNAFIEEDGEMIHIEPAEYEHDISDIPPHLLSLFSNYGICLGELDALLVKGELLHG
ncbi:hypothetical protein [Oscillibacter ruminantium]|uniref:hypothetical protein n=1 Tax=Oscillibacter ruminantium TaxID=1263547 RepID=UPI0033198675